MESLKHAQYILAHLPHHALSLVNRLRYHYTTQEDTHVRSRAAVSQWNKDGRLAYFFVGIQFAYKCSG